jgi:hypothetical protein
MPTKSLATIGVLSIDRRLRRSILQQPHLSDDKFFQAS